MPDHFRVTRWRTSDTRFTSPSRNLYHIIEAQIHGDIRLARDVGTLVVDGGFKSTAIGRCLEDICCKYQFPVQYHHDFKLNAKSVSLGFRGPIMPSLSVLVTAVWTHGQ